MGMRVNTNITALRSSNALRKNNSELSKSYEALSTGLRINRSSDDPAGLAISSKALVEAQSYEQSMRNIEDAYSISTIAESAYNEIFNNLSRVRELAVYASTETITNAERSYINTESSTLLQEIDRIASTTQFNGILLLNAGSTAGIQDYKQIMVQAGIYNGVDSTAIINLGGATLNALRLDPANIYMDTANSAHVAITGVDFAMNLIQESRSLMGTLQNGLDHGLSREKHFIELRKTLSSNLRDTDFAVETANLSKRQILQQSGVAILSQANSSSQIVQGLL